MSPVTQKRERPEVYASVDEALPRWENFNEGIGYFHGKAANPKIEFWALRVDLASSGISFYVDGGRTEGDQTLSRNVTSFVRENNLVAGINALPFDVISAKENKPIKNAGLVISDGKMISPARPEYDALVFFTDGTVSIISQAELEISDIQNAAGGFRQVLSGGEPVQRVTGPGPRHPRSAAGIAADGRFLYLLVVDGRRPGSVGVTELELAVLLRALGASEGINFDGGGSSALVLRCPDGKIKAVNTPIHKQVPGLQRAVAGCLGITR